MLICQTLKHFPQVVCFLITSLWCMSSFAQVSVFGRKPANFVPDDDMIIVPMVVEKNFIDEFNEKHEKEFKGARQKLNYWMKQEQYAKDYGLQNTGMVNIPSQEQKEQFFKRNYLRFIQKDVERSNQEVLNGIVQEWTTDDEIASIKALEQRDAFIVKAKRQKGQKIYKAKKEIKVAGKKFRFDIQPRVEMGMMKVRIDTPYFEMRGWLGVNGNQEVKLYRRFTSTGTNALVNYYIEQKRLLGVVDQRLAKHWSLRLTHDKILTSFDSIDQAGVQENNGFQIRFGMGF